jgi:hypothetical protein
MLYEAAIEDEAYSRPWKISMTLYRHVERLHKFRFKCVPFAEELLYGNSEEVKRCAPALHRETFPLEKGPAKATRALVVADSPEPRLVEGPMVISPVVIFWLPSRWHWRRSSSLGKKHRPRQAMESQKPIRRSGHQGLWELSHKWHTA